MGIANLQVCDIKDLVPRASVGVEASDAMRRKGSLIFSNRVRLKKIRSIATESAADNRACLYTDDVRAIFIGDIPRSVYAQNISMSLICKIYAEIDAHIQEKAP